MSRWRQETGERHAKGCKFMLQELHEQKLVELGSASLRQ